MLPSEATAALAADERLGVVVDRRRLDGKRAVPSDLQVVADIDIAAGSPGVRVALVMAVDGGLLPRRDPTGRHEHVRLMDRFYLPAVRDQSVTAPMFDLIAGIYDTLTNRDLNLATASRLLRTALAGTPPDATILDFGCGTGVAADALAAMATSAKLLGVDVSAAMLSHARQRGLEVLPIAMWRLDPPLVDGAIANFVLHYGVSTADLSRIGRSLRPNGAFAANLFGAEPRLLAEVAGVLAGEGLVLEGWTPSDRTSRPDLLLSFRKPR